MTDSGILRGIFYSMAIIFYVLLLFTSTGNYLHEGTPVGFIAMQGIAVVIFIMATRIFIQVKTREKFAVVLFAVGPLFFVVASLASAFF